MGLRRFVAFRGAMAAVAVAILLAGAPGLAVGATAGATGGAGAGIELLGYRPTSGRAGTLVTVTGRGATPRATIEIGGASRSSPAGCAGGRLGGQGSPDPYGTGTADGNGDFAIAFRVPLALRAATMISFRAYEASPGGLSTAAACFDITDSDYTFPETGKTVRGDFRAYWEAHNQGTYGYVASATAIHGFPIGEVVTETLEDGQPHQIQYFERARLEYHVVPPYDFAVLLGQLGRQLHPADPPIPPPPGAAIFPGAPSGAQALYFPATGHSIARREFADFWQAAGGADGGLPAFGYPLAEEQDELIDGRAVRVQYFERARFEWHPEAPEWARVQLAPLGRIACGDRCR